MDWEQANRERIWVTSGWEFDMSLQCVLTVQKSNCILDCIKSSMASKWSEVILPLCSVLVRAHLEHWVQLWGSQHKDRDVLEQAKRNSTRMIKELEYLSYEDRLRKQWLYSLEKRRLLGNLIGAFHYLKGAYKAVERVSGKLPGRKGSGGIGC